MKKLVNGVPTELSPTGQVRVEAFQDRLLVRSPEGLHTALVVRRGADILVSYRGQQHVISPLASALKSEDPAASGDLRSQLPGQVVEVLRQEGDLVEKGDKILILEAMKMQQAVVAPFKGTLGKVAAKAGDQVAENAFLAHVSPVQ